MREEYPTLWGVLKQDLPAGEYSLKIKLDDF